MTTKKIFAVIGEFATAFLGVVAIFFVVSLLVTYVSLRLQAVEEIINGYVSYGIALVFPALFLLYLWLKWSSIWVWVGGVLGFMVLVLLLLSSISSGVHASRGRRDARRISDLKQYQLALSIYAQQNSGLYPPLQPPSACLDITAVGDYLLRDQIMPSIASDPLVSTSHDNYKVAVSGDRKSYVIRAVLGNNDNSVLKSDIDGNVLGCNCNDPNYCVTS